MCVCLHERVLCVCVFMSGISTLGVTFWPELRDYIRAAMLTRGHQRSSPASLEGLRSEPQEAGSQGVIKGATHSKQRTPRILF